MHGIIDQIDLSHTILL